jgi:NADPH:quinone reductase-like Zn-dependent oxidoreductase
MLQTAYGSLTVGLALEPGQTVLIRGGTSSVGLMAAAVAKDMGVTVLATTRRADRLGALASHGVDHPILDGGEIAGRVRELVAGGVDAVLELVGTPTLRDSLRAVRVHGTVCSTGMVSHQFVVPDFFPQDYLPHGVRLTACTAHARNFIDGDWTDTDTITESLDPATGEVLGTYADGGADEARAAIAAARRAFGTSDWSRDRDLRAKALFEMADRMAARQDELIELLSRESGKIRSEAALEVGLTISKIRYYSALALTESGRASEVKPGLYSMTLRQPLHRVRQRRCPGDRRQPRCGRPQLHRQYACRPQHHGRRVRVAEGDVPGSPPRWRRYGSAPATIRPARWVR